MSAISSARDPVAADPGGAALARSPMRGRWVAGAGRVRARALMSSPPLRRCGAGAHGVGGGGRQGGDLPVGDGRGPSSRCGAGPGAPGSVRRGRCRSWPRAGRRPRAGALPAAAQALIGSGLAGGGAGGRPGADDPWGRRAGGPPRGRAGPAPQEPVPSMPIIRMRPWERTKSRGWSWPAGVAGTRMSPGPAPVAALPAATWWVSLWVSTPATTPGSSPGSVPGARPGGVRHHDDAPSSWWARRSGPSGSGR